LHWYLINLLEMKFIEQLTQIMIRVNIYARFRDSIEVHYGIDCNWNLAFMVPLYAPAICTSLIYNYNINYRKINQ
jgi:hypothetical protein